jgi:hypothetical protein
MTEYDVKAVMYKPGSKGERLELKYIRGHVEAANLIEGAKIAEKYIRKTYKMVPEVTNVNIYRYRRGAEIVRFN